MSDMKPGKAFVFIAFNINQTFFFEFLNLLGNLMEELPD